MNKLFKKDISNLVTPCLHPPKVFSLLLEQTQQLLTVPGKAPGVWLLPLPTHAGPLCFPNHTRGLYTGRSPAWHALPSSARGWLSLSL